VALLAFFTTFSTLFIAYGSDASGCYLAPASGCNRFHQSEGSSDGLLSRGVLGHNLKQLLNGFWLLAADLVDQGATRSVIPEGRNDIGVCHTWECVALLGKTSNVIQEGLTLLLLAALEVLGVVEAHIGALEVAGEDLPQVAPMVSGVF
jgi:hypothetical protein